MKCKFCSYRSGDRNSMVYHLKSAHQHSVRTTLVSSRSSSYNSSSDLLTDMIIFDSLSDLMTDDRSGGYSDTFSGGGGDFGGGGASYDYGSSDSSSDSGGGSDD